MSPAASAGARPAGRLRAALLALAAAAAGCGGGPAPLEAGIDGAYVIQSAQDYGGAVPLVRGRAGLVRVFARAAAAGLPAPAVRVRLYDASGALLTTYADAVAPPPATLPTEVDEAAPGASWSFPVPGADVQPGRYLVAELDPVAGVPASRTRATFRVPAAGTLDVRDVPAVTLTLVPVVQAPPGQAPLAPLVSGAEPGGGARTADGWLDRARRIHPLLLASVRLGATYTTATALDASGAGWLTLLAELDQKRVADGSPYAYLGAVHVAYALGTTGIAYLATPGQPRAALAWDAGSTPDDPEYQRVAAHEVGHLLGLMHAPCGAPADTVDASWPSGAAYAGGHTGVMGWDPLDGALKPPATTFDQMGYCGTIGTTWTSDYDYRRVLSFLGASAPAVASGPGAVAARQLCLVVAGRIRGGAVELEPAYALDTVPSLPPPGDYALDLVDASGARLASVPFAPSLVQAERAGAPEERHFALALPLAPGWAEAARGLAVRAGGAVLHRRALAAPAGGAAPALDLAAAGGGAWLSWDARAHPAALVRDPRTGEVLAFLRGGAGLVRTAAPELEVVLSDRLGAGRRVAPAR